ncbi:MAG: HEPN domain-containing protein [Bacteroidales bacterium]
MKFAIKDFFGMSYDDLFQETVKNQMTTHTYVIKYFSEQIKTKIGNDAYKDFNRKIKDLKNFREVSDYEDKEVTADESRKALEYAKEIRNFLKDTFHLT